MNSSTVVNLHNVSLTLQGPEGNVSILKNVSLQVQDEETVSITGPSGSGKTSLLMVIAGVEQTTGGSVNVAGKDITVLSEDALAAFRQRHIGIVFQHFHLIPTMNALENVAVPLEFSNQRDAFRQAEQALKEVGLEHRLHHFPSQLSGGEQQRVALARAFVMRPTVLLADEPTGNLDSQTGERVIELLFRMKQEFGTTLLLITHDRKLAERTDRQVRMQDGCIL